MQGSFARCLMLLAVDSHMDQEACLIGSARFGAERDLSCGEAASPHQPWSPPRPARMVSGGVLVCRKHLTRPLPGSRARSRSRSSNHLSSSSSMPTQSQRSQASPVFPSTAAGSPPHCQQAARRASSSTLPPQQHPGGRGRQVPVLLVAPVHKRQAQLLQHRSRNTIPWCCMTMTNNHKPMHKDSQQLCVHSAVPTSPKPRS